MPDNWQSDLATARRIAEQEAYAKASIAQAEANRLQRQRDVEAGNAQVWKNLEQQREKQSQELRQRQHQDIMWRQRQAAGPYSTQSRSSGNGFVKLIFVGAMVWLGAVMLHFVQGRAGLTSSTRGWTRADGTRMREDIQYGMGGLIVTSDRTYPDPDQNSRRLNHKAVRRPPNHRANYRS